MGVRKYVIVLLFAGVFIVNHLQGIVEGNLEMLRESGDSVIGSLEPICVPTASSSCGDFDINGLLKVEAIIYAVDNINKQKQELGNNGTLGYEIRDTREGVYKSLLKLVVTPETPRQKPMAVIGSLADNKLKDSLFLLLSQQMTHVSCDSTAVVNNNLIRQSDIIFHVYPSDKTSIKSMVDFIAKNNWSYVGAVTDDKAENMLSVLKDESKAVCVGPTYTLPHDANDQQIAQFVRTMNARKNYTVIVALTNHELTKKILEEASKQKVKDLTWIVGQRAWPNTRPIPKPNSASQGMFSLLSRKSTAGFADHLRSLKSGVTKIKNIWLREMASESSPPSNGTSSANASTPTTPPSCDYNANPRCGINQSKLNAAVDKMISAVENSACTIDAVFTIAKALAEKERCMSSPDCKEDVTKFHNFVRRLDFTNPLTGSRISFTPEGYLNFTLYHIYNYQQNYSRITTDLNKYLKAVDVGTWAYSPEVEPKLKLSVARIEWHGGHSKRQDSRCHEACPAGKKKTWKTKRIGAECCWECKKCPAKKYSDTKDASECKECPKNQRVSLSQTGCVPFFEDYVHWEHGGSLVILFLMVVGLCFSIYVSFVLFRNGDTPIMKNAKSAVLYLLPFVVIMFLLPIPLLGRPTVASCEGYRVFFILALGIPLAVLLAKSHFFDNRCKDQSENSNGMCTPRFSIVCFIVLCHVFVALILALVAPAKVLELPTDRPHTVFLECSYHSSYEFLIVIFYTMFIAVLVSVFSVNEILSEGNFYEVKWISFAMFNWYAITFFYVVFTFGTHYHAKIIMLALMDLFYAVNIFGFLYLPKWFIVVFRPEKNRSDVSPWTDYIKTQERVSERLSAPEESPVMTRKEKLADKDETPEAKGLMADTDI